MKDSTRQYLVSDACVDLREVVERVSRIERALMNGHTSPTDVRVLLPYLEKQRDLLTKQLAFLGMIAADRG